MAWVAVVWLAVCGWIGAEAIIRSDPHVQETFAKLAEANKSGDILKTLGEVPDVSGWLPPSPSDNWVDVLMELEVKQRSLLIPSRVVVQNTVDRFLQPIRVRLIISGLLQHMLNSPEQVQALMYFFAAKLQKENRLVYGENLPVSHLDQIANKDRAQNEEHNGELLRKIEMYCKGQINSIDQLDKMFPVWKKRKLPLLTGSTASRQFPDSGLPISGHGHHSEPVGLPSNYVVQEASQENPPNPIEPKLDPIEPKPDAIEPQLDAIETTVFGVASSAEIAKLTKELKLAKEQLRAAGIRKAASNSVNSSKGLAFDFQTSSTFRTVLYVYFASFSSFIIVVAALVVANRRQQRRIEDLSNRAVFHAARGDVILPVKGDFWRRTNTNSLLRSSSVSKEIY